MGIRVEHLTKRFGAFTALADVGFEVGAGELVALLGPSGGGKSTILRIIAGLDQPDEGAVYLDGERVEGVPANEREVGFVFQHYALFRHMTVAQNVEFGLHVQKVPKGERRARVAELLQLVGLAGLEQRRPAQLSGGQRQRVALARALAPRPRLLLLDEPFAAVDAKVREELRDWVRRLHEQVHLTSVFVTHDQEEAFALADRVVIVREGRVEQVGTPLEIMDQPCSEFVARFIGEANVYGASVAGGQARVGSVSIRLADAAPAGPARVVVRSYDLKLWADADGPVRIARMVPLGDRVRVEGLIDGEHPVVACFPRRSSLLRGMEAGGRAAIEVTRARAYPCANGAAAAASNT